MPFTPAHVAAVLPFRSSRLVWSALVVGAVAPDLEYFLRMSPQDRYGHALPGLLLFTLPLGLLTLWLFHAFVKAPFVELMPEALERRLARVGEFRFGGAARFGLIVASLLVGILTHLAWDSFTHGDTWTIRHLHALGHSVPIPYIGFVAVYKLLQHVSTVVGLAILVVWLVMCYRTSVDSAGDHDGVKDHVQGVWPRRKVMTIGAITIFAGLGAVFRAWSEIGIPSNHSTLAQFMGELAATMIALLWWQFVVLGIWRRSKRQSG